MESGLSESSNSDNNSVVNFLFYLSLSCFCIFALFALLVVGRKFLAAQNSHNTQQTGSFIGTCQGPSDTPADPTVYISPPNLPPPPKYEAMAPPSYEEVVGLHYSNFQPISHSISIALAQTSNTTDVNVANNSACDANNANFAPINNLEGAITSNKQNPPMVISVISERSPVTASS